MSLADTERNQQTVDEKTPLADDGSSKEPEQQLNEKQPPEETNTNEKVPTSSEVINVVRQQNLARKASLQDLPFDFNQFLEQMKQKSAEPIARYVKNFQREFERKPWTINEQIKIVHDFLNFVSKKMADCELWCNASEKEFENAKEGIEKLVMNRLYALTFSPAIKGQVTTDDRERDEILHQKIQIFRWVKEEHLDIPITAHNEKFLSFAKQELLKINAFKAPRDKLICILNCCKVIFGLIRQVDGEEGADKFLPILIFVVLRANPEHLISNVQYISRFRNPEKLQSEAGYYLSSLMGAISFIENMDVSSLSITQEDFDKNIEITMKELERERPRPEENDSVISYDNVIHPSRSVQLNKAPTILNPAQAKALLENGRNFAQRTIQKPLTIVGRIISEIANDVSESRILEVRSPSQSSSRSTSPSINEPPPLPPRAITEGGEDPPQQGRPRSLSDSSYTSQAFNDFDDLQVEVARANAAEYESSLATLRAIFPNMGADICESVLQASDGGLSRAIDILLEMSDPNTNGRGDGRDLGDGDDVINQTNVGEHAKNEVSAVF